jgi:hypothetical protein
MVLNHETHAALTEWRRQLEGLGLNRALFGGAANKRTAASDTEGVPRPAIIVNWSKHGMVQFRLAPSQAREALTS